MSWWRGIYRNNRPTSGSTGATTWKIISTDGNAYDTYGALIAAGKTPFPGDNNDFPTGAPVVTVQTVNSNAAGSPFYVKINTINTPASSDLGSFFSAGSGQTPVFEGVGVRLVWVKQTTSGDSYLASAYF